MEVKDYKIYFPTNDVGNYNVESDENELSEDFLNKFDKSVTTIIENNTFADGNYKEIVKQCLKSNKLYEDPDFPANDHSLEHCGRLLRNIKWLRPNEIVHNPNFFVKGYDRFDVRQGKLGDCWFLAATANLTMHNELFKRVVPINQTFTNNYVGAFHFFFWQYGRWINIIVDDKLPTHEKKLIFMHSTETNEFWSALLEKAYAKLHGSYEALNGGRICDAMVDFTGGVIETYDLKKSTSRMFKLLLKAYERNSMIGCSIFRKYYSNNEEEKIGLVSGHAYSITKVQVIDLNKNQIEMLRIRNPWGTEEEWKGPWSDNSSEWTNISDKIKKSIGLTFDHDGEFWISFNDFLIHFDNVEICNIRPDSLQHDNDRKKIWEISTFENEWKLSGTAGGRNNEISYWNNPQYLITLTEPDENETSDLCTIIVALMQKNRRTRLSCGNNLLFIGFSIYSVKESELIWKPLPQTFFDKNLPVAKSYPAYSPSREVTTRFALPPGHYCIIPSTSESISEGKFLIRVFSEKKNQIEINSKKIRNFQPNIPKVFYSNTDQNQSEFAIVAVEQEIRSQSQPTYVSRSRPKKNCLKFENILVTIAGIFMGLFLFFIFAIYMKF